jgi:hypothetical protein
VNGLKKMTPCVFVLPFNFPKVLLMPTSPGRITAHDVINAERQRIKNIFVFMFFEFIDV